MDKYIACTTKKQWEDVLKKFEEDGYKWLVGNSVLSGLDYFMSYKSESVIHVHPDTKRLEFGNKDFYKGGGIKTFISAHDFLKGAKTKPIVISRNGRVVTAEDKNTGEKGVATCSPSDEFDFKIGAKIALARLWGEEVPKSLLNDDEKHTFKNTVTTFKVGDLVTLKEGLKIGESYGGIRFLNGMYWQGHHKPMKVVEADEYCAGRCDNYRCVSADGESSVYFWFSKEMLEKYEDEIHEGDTVRITDTGKQYTTYNEWIKRNITDVDLICKFDYNRDASTDGEYVVVKIAEHGMHNKTLAYVKEKTNLWPRCYLIDVKGLEKVTK